MHEYQHTQSGTLILCTLGSAAVITGGIAAFFSLIPGWVMLPLVVCAYLFSSLTVKVSREQVTLRFGPGLIKKSFAVIDICNVEIVRNHWYYGWGIKLTPHGWLYNVSGFEAVEIQLQNRRKYRIGTDEPRELHAAIQTAMKQSS